MDHLHLNEMNRINKSQWRPQSKTRDF